MNRQAFIVHHYNSVFSGNVRMVNFFVFTYYFYILFTLFYKIPPKRTALYCITPGEFPAGSTHCSVSGNASCSYDALAVMGKLH